MLYYVNAWIFLSKFSRNSPTNCLRIDSIRYVYQRQYESGGVFWPLVAHKVVGCTFICVLFTATVLILKAAYTQAGIMLATLPLCLLRFDL